MYNNVIYNNVIIRQILILGLNQGEYIEIRPIWWGRAHGTETHLGRLWVWERVQASLRVWLLLG